MNTTHCIGRVKGQIIDNTTHTLCKTNTEKNVSLHSKGTIIHQKTVEGITVVLFRSAPVAALEGAQN